MSSIKLFLVALFVYLSSFSVFAQAVPVADFLKEKAKLNQTDIGSLSSADDFAVATNGATPIEISRGYKNLKNTNIILAVTKKRKGDKAYLTQITDYNGDNNADSIEVVYIQGNHKKKANKQGFAKMVTLFRGTQRYNYRVAMGWSSGSAALPSYGVEVAVNPYDVQDTAVNIITPTDRGQKFIKNQFEKADAILKTIATDEKAIKGMWNSLVMPAKVIESSDSEWVIQMSLENFTTTVASQVLLSMDPE